MDSCAQIGLPVYILAGGSNRRFGSDKARALLWGEPLLLHVVDALARWAGAVSVIADRADKYSDLGLRTLADQEPGLGPVGGLARALEDLGREQCVSRALGPHSRGGSPPRAPGEWLLLTPCDLIGIQPGWLHLLQDHQHEGARVAAFRGERWQPLPALFHAAALDDVRAFLARGQRALWRLIESMPHAQIPLPDDWNLAVQVNSVEDLVALARGRGSTARPRPT